MIMHVSLSRRMCVRSTFRCAINCILQAIQYINMMWTVARRVLPFYAVPNESAR